MTNVTHFVTVLGLDYLGLDYFAPVATLLPSRHNESYHSLILWIDLSIPTAGPAEHHFNPIVLRHAPKSVDKGFDSDSGDGSMGKLRTLSILPFSSAEESRLRTGPFRQRS